MILEAINTPEPDLEESLGKYIAMVTVLAGIKEAPDEMIFQSCLAFWKQFYPQFRAAELLTAFQMNLAGELGERIQHYQSLDVNYISALMNAYKKPRGAAVVKTYDEKPMEYTAEQKMQLRIDGWEWILKQYTSYKENRKYTVHMTAYWFGQFEEHGFIFMTLAQKNELVERVRKYMQSRVDKGVNEFRDLKEYRAMREMLAGRNQAALILACRERAIMEYWDEIPADLFSGKVESIIELIKNGEI